IGAVNVAQLEATATVVSINQLRQAVGQAAGTDIVNGGNRIVPAQCHTGVDDFLAAALHFRVGALHGGEVQFGAGTAAGHGRGRAAAQADEHGRAAENDKASIHGHRLLVDVTGTDVAHAAGNHDRLVIA